MNQLASCEVPYSSGNWLIVIMAILGPSKNETPVTENHQIITTCSKLWVFPTCTIPCKLWVFPRKIPIYIRGNTHNSEGIVQVGEHHSSCHWKYDVMIPIFRWLGCCSSVIASRMVLFPTGVSCSCSPKNPVTSQWNNSICGMISPLYNWLVVDLPLWKIWVRQLGWWHSQYMEK